MKTPHEFSTLPLTIHHRTRLERYSEALTMDDRTMSIFRLTSLTSSNLQARGSYWWARQQQGGEDTVQAGPSVPRGYIGHGQPAKLSPPPPPPPLHLLLLLSFKL